LANGGDRYEFSPMLGDIAPVIAGADLALCHLETPLSPHNDDLSGYPTFNVPHEIATDAAEAGYDGCSTASNHSLDKGPAGVVATIDLLQQAGLRHAGTARSAEEAATATIHDVGDVGVAHLSYTYGHNGAPPPADQPWLVATIDPTRITSDAAAARQAGADFVVVSLQWGAEYQHQPTAQQRQLAETLLTSSDVDLIVGSHVHVVQPIAKIGDKYVAYGIGNLLSNQGAPSTPAASQDGMILQVAVAEQPDGTFRTTRIAYTPTWVRKPDFVVTLASPMTNPASFERTRAAVDGLGAAAAGVEPIFEPLARP
jgi:poly-gamma-glutamate capsule biosynthesis protein CapA/YwtB (metallophosphatase superfamily)